MSVCWDTKSRIAQLHALQQTLTTAARVTRRAARWLTAARRAARGAPLRNCVCTQAQQIRFGTCSVCITVRSGTSVVAQFTPARSPTSAEAAMHSDSDGTAAGRLHRSV